MLKILTIGDAHFKENFGYASFVKDRRIGEHEATLDVIVEKAKDCDAIVFMGDNFDRRHNASSVIARFVAFLERFGDKPLFILAGNHEKFGDGKSAIDFLGEIKGKPWHVITKGPEVHQVDGLRCVFLPYMTGPELRTSSTEAWEEISDRLSASLPDGDVLFAHHAVSGTFPWGEQEAVLRSEIILKKFKQVVVGHIHEYGQYMGGRVVLTGSIFTDSIGEERRGVFTFTYEGNSPVDVKMADLPVRPILKLENPGVDKTLAAIPKNAIVKVVITDREYDVSWLEKALKRFDGSLIVWKYATERASVKSLDMEELTVQKLLQSYAEAKEIDLNLLLRGFELIN